MENTEHLVDTETGWVACDYTEGDTLDEVRHGRVYSHIEDAVKEQHEGGYDGVRYLHTDGYLYVDAQG